MDIMDLWLEDEDKANEKIKETCEKKVIIESKQGLTAGNLKKRENLRLFLSKITNGDEMELISGEKVTIPADKNEDLISKLRAALENPQLLKGSIFFIDSEGKKRTTGSLRKTKEFGGGISPTAKEDLARGSLEKLLKIALSDSDTDAIILRILDAKGDIIAEFDDVVGNVPTTKGVPKSDFEIQRKDGKPDIFVSHKDGSTPSGFSQWGGTTQAAGKEIMNHPEVLRFAKDVRKRIGVSSVGEGLFEFHYPSKISFGRKIKDDKLKKMAIFGKDYSPDAEGSRNNVDLVVQGNFTLTRAEAERTKDDKEIENVYILGANHIAYRKNLKGDLLSGPYEPILVTRYAKDRNNHGIKYCRMVIYPLGGRKYTEI